MWTGPNLWSPARHPDSHVGQDVVLLDRAVASAVGERCRLACGTAAAASGPREKRPTHSESGNAGNGSLQTLPVFFVFWERSPQTRCRRCRGSVALPASTLVCWRKVGGTTTARKGAASTRPAARQTTTKATAATPVTGFWQGPRKKGTKGGTLRSAVAQTIMSIAGHVSRAMLSRYSHVWMEAKRRALDEIAARQRAADVKRKDAEQREAATVSQAAVVQ